MGSLNGMVVLANLNDRSVTDHDQTVRSKELDLHSDIVQGIERIQ